MLLPYVRMIISVCCLCLAGTAFTAERPKLVKREDIPKSAPVTVPVTILSIIPVQAEPGARILLSGTGFGDSITVFLGSVEIAARITGDRQVEFTLPPQLEAGLYALYLKRADGTIGKSYNFTVLPLRPVLGSLDPPLISSCAAGKDREVIARGKYFGDTTLLFFDGATLTSTLLSPESISFTVPNVPGGLHQILVKNGPDNNSAPRNLAVETKPEIGQVTVGDEFVNFYELIITGKNFTRNSSVYVDGMQIGGNGGQNLTEREKLLYVDCTRLIYQRHPFSPVTKDFLLQVMNPGGEASQVITVTAP